MGTSCISDLISENLPPPNILSVELPVDDGGHSANRLLKLLQVWGYRYFKISRQSTYAPRCWPGRLNCQDAPPPAAAGHLRGYSTTLSGLLGDAAVDYISGTRWREFTFTDWGEE